MNKFEVGKQPCDIYIGHMDGNGHASWINEHECVFCSKAGGDGLVSFCENCHRDHHAGGYEKCLYSAAQRCSEVPK